MTAPPPPPPLPAGAAAAAAAAAEQQQQQQRRQQQRQQQRQHQLRRPGGATGSAAAGPPGSIPLPPPKVFEGSEQEAAPPPPTAAAGAPPYTSTRRRRKQQQQQQQQQQRQHFGVQEEAMLPGELQSASIQNYEEAMPVSLRGPTALAELCVKQQPKVQQSPLKEQQHCADTVIKEFKTEMCTNTSSSHDHRSCKCYHSDRDRRRAVLGAGGAALYRAEPCQEKFDSHKTCPRGDSCSFSHSTAELLYHPDVFRKRLCHQAEKCPRRKFCAFAHTRDELLVPHFTCVEEQNPTEEFIAYSFKTQWCPIGDRHNWENCVYAHTYRDWRRTPIIGYSSRPCPQWTQSLVSGSPEIKYQARCPRGMACALAHGSKEQLYHPSFYKTSPCVEAYCKRGVLCAFMHGAYDARKPPTQLEAAAALADRLSGTEGLLERLQPTYMSPPKYHALEEQVQSCLAGYSLGSAPKTRGGGRRHQVPAPLQLGDRTTGPPRAPRAFTGPGGNSMDLNPSPQHPAGCPQDIPCAPTYSWDLQGANGEFLPAQQADDACPYYPVAWHNGGGFQSMVLPNGCTPYVCHWVACVDSQTQLLQPPTGYGDNSDPWGFQAGVAQEVPWEHQRPGPCVPAHHLPLDDGTRTPSSFCGTPVASATPTNTRSPRTEEATDCSELTASVEDAVRFEPTGSNRGLRRQAGNSMQGGGRGPGPETAAVPPKAVTWQVW